MWSYLVVLDRDNVDLFGCSAIFVAFNLQTIWSYLVVLDADHVQ
jgi:hypothetical protein